ncbi:MAG: energy transducer TonB [Halieaceae bacterium]
MIPNRAVRLIFWRPALFTLLLHVALLYALTVNWSSSSDAAVKPVQKPRYIEARLIEIEAPKSKPKPKPKSKPKPKPKPKPKAQAKPKPKPTVAAKPKPKPEPKPEPKPKPPTAEERAAAALDELAMAMESEDEQLEAASDEQLTQSYVALIARAIEDNWSRPPSARNDMEAELVIQLIPTGEVVSVTIARSSGQSAFDRSAVLAVQKAERFPELQQLEPRLFERNFRSLRLKFKPEDLRY